MVDRAARGAVFTPEPIGRALLEAALAGGPPPGSVADPAAGDGRLLALAREAAPEAEVFAADIDPVAWRTGPGASLTGARFAEVDVLASRSAIWPDAPARGIDLVVGNPPFLDQLDARSARRPDERRELRERFGDAASGYADAAALFLVAACEMAAPTGRVAYIMPASFLGARDAAPARRRVLELATLDGIWFGGLGVFEDAEVQVCAVVLDRSGPRRRSVRRWSGPDWRPAPRVEVDADELRVADTWGPLVASLVDDELPHVELDGGPTLGDLAAVGAGFRDQFYGLAPLIADVGGPVTARRDGLAPMITSGLVDPGRVAWGARTARIAGTRWTTPGIDPRVVPEGRLARWVAAQRRPKVLVASQTPVIEAAPDPTGEWVPSTPVVSVHADGEDLWRALAVLLAPPVAAWARARAAGSALAPRSIRVSAPLLRSVPLPGDVTRWEAAADLLRRGHRPAGCDHEALRGAAEMMTAAYGCGAEVDVWWASCLGRLPAP